MMVDQAEAAAGVLLVDDEVGLASLFFADESEVLFDSGEPFESDEVLDADESAETLSLPSLPDPPERLSVR
jgi:hypothetical protein